MDPLLVEAAKTITQSNSRVVYSNVSYDLLVRHTILHSGGDSNAAFTKAVRLMGYYYSLSVSISNKWKRIKNVYSNGDAFADPDVQSYVHRSDELTASIQQEYGKDAVDPQTQGRGHHIIREGGLKRLWNSTVRQVLGTQEKLEEYEVDLFLGLCDSANLIFAYCKERGELVEGYIKKMAVLGGILLLEKTRGNNYGNRYASNKEKISERLSNIVLELYLETVKNLVEQDESLLGRINDTDLVLVGGEEGYYNNNEKVKNWKRQGAVLSETLIYTMMLNVPLYQNREWVFKDLTFAYPTYTLFPSPLPCFLRLFHCYSPFSLLQHDLPYITSTNYTLLSEYRRSSIPFFLDIIELLIPNFRGVDSNDSHFILDVLVDNIIVFHNLLSAECYNSWTTAFESAHAVFLTILNNIGDLFPLSSKKNIADSTPSLSKISLFAPSYASLILDLFKNNNLPLDLVRIAYSAAVHACTLSNNHQVAWDLCSNTLLLTSSNADSKLLLDSWLLFTDQLLTLSTPNLISNWRPVVDSTLFSFSSSCSLQLQRTVLSNISDLALNKSDISRRDLATMPGNFGLKRLKAKRKEMDNSKTDIDLADKKAVENESENKPTVEFDDTHNESETKKRKRNFTPDKIQFFKEETQRYRDILEAKILQLKEQKNSGHECTHQETNQETDTTQSQQFEQYDIPKELASVESLDNLSKNQLKKILKNIKWEENKQHRRQAERLKKKLKKQAQRQDLKNLQKGTETGSDVGTESGIYKTQQKTEKKQEWHGYSVVIDCSFDQLMKDHEITSITNQLVRVYSCNKSANYPVALSFFNFCGRTRTRFENKLSDYRNWNSDYISFVPPLSTHPLPELDYNPITFVNSLNNNRDTTQCGDINIENPYTKYLSATPSSSSPSSPTTTVQQAHKQKQLVYLTADSPNTLDTLSTSDIYIIGGFVDKNRYKNLTLDIANHFNIRTAKLPLSDHLSNLKTRTVITVNQVFEILLHAIEYQQRPIGASTSGCDNVNPWKLALDEVIPSRKLV
ncbi:tRNA (guanine(9)-N1)-methyltransferase [Zancudomyces culisetae]|uniref:tRNA (guanine(9)-N1)-methyltransferase n=1 Tax=Zancudomyces culisetae TaxID=1213189 RepID=A0A1R1PFR1_ZANCU|nr:tRNA (guanine(9)-N1)-methyltransferase [Zancudomyces culisetae]OMH80572.1 tRNA (guanine(9)-N1)-methyltransferase [Zancudomyces culisetae]|eukprot:OMH79786.1 tRNA (guanine(9)-N1)-methyltransferase [Zancudomyces culisetae]